MVERTLCIRTAWVIGGGTHSGCGFGFEWIRLAKISNADTSLSMIPIDSKKQLVSRVFRKTACVVYLVSKLGPGRQIRRNASSVVAD